MPKVLWNQERWPSGLRRRSRKAESPHGDRGFESHPLRSGEMLEWLNRHAWKACRACKGSRGFESRSLRQS